MSGVEGPDMAETAPGERTVERPEEKLAGGSGADPLLGGEEGFIGWIGGWVSAGTFCLISGLDILLVNASGGVVGWCEG